MLWGWSVLSSESTCITINNIFLKGWQYIVTQEVIVNWDEADVHNVFWFCKLLALHNNKKKMDNKNTYSSAAHDEIFKKQQKNVLVLYVIISHVWEGDRLIHYHPLQKVTY
jgi:hypothetical protein